MEAQVKGAVFSSLDDAQRSFASHHDACSTLAKVCMTDAVVFWKYTIQALNRVLVIYSRDPPVERLVEFFSKFAVYLSSKESNTEGKNGSNHRDACTTFMRYLIHHTSASSKAVRFRTTQILSRILVNLPEDAEISEAVWVRPHTQYICAILENARDLATVSFSNPHLLPSFSDSQCSCRNRFWQK